MILLDTNVISAFMNPTPDEVVVAWLDRQLEGSVWTTAISVFEIEFGLQRLAQSKRRKRLKKAFLELLAEELDGRILPFDTAAAINAGALSAALQAKGRPLEIRDLQIASIARVRNAPVATRNVKHFADACEVRNPWEDA